MHRFHLPPDQCREPILSLAGREAHHALHVLRVRRGESVAVLDGAGREFLCEVQDLGRDSLSLSVVKERVEPPLPCRLTLLQAVPKGKLLESIIQKATELGAARIVPLLAERVAVRVDDEAVLQKGQKWQQVAVEAIKQCGAVWLPRVETPITPAAFLAGRDDSELALLGSLQSDSRHPRQYLEAFRASHGRLPASVSVWIGPEGDFTDGEISAIQAGGAFPITLGRLVLRTETAAIYCLSFLNYEISAGRDVSR